MADRNTKQAVRTRLPVLEAADKPPLPPATPPNADAESDAKNVGPSDVSPPVSPSPVSAPSSASVTPAPELSSPAVKTETARIQVVPDPVSSPEQKANAESVVPTPDIVPQDSSIAAKAQRKKSSMFLFWVLLAVSALILIIQIWIYLS